MIYYMTHTNIYTLQMKVIAEFGEVVSVSWIKYIKFMYGTSEARDFMTHPVVYQYTTRSTTITKLAL